MKTPCDHCHTYVAVACITLTTIAGTVLDHANLCPQCLAHVAEEVSLSPGQNILDKPLVVV
jgi:hypothetical protein